MSQELNKSGDELLVAAEAECRAIELAEQLEKRRKACAVCIDPNGSKCPEQAIWISDLGGGERMIEFFVCDTTVVGVGSLTEELVQRNVATTFKLDRQEDRLMTPRILSHEILPFHEGLWKPAQAFNMKYDINTRRARFVGGVEPVALLNMAQLSYQDVEGYVDAGKVTIGRGWGEAEIDFGMWWELARSLEETRLESGDSLLIKRKSNKYQENFPRAYGIQEQLSVLLNGLVWGYMRENGIGFGRVFESSEVGWRILPMEEILADDLENRTGVEKIDTKVTAPLRDLVSWITLRSVAANMNGLDEPYSGEEKQVICERVNQFRWDQWEKVRKLPKKKLAREEKMARRLKLLKNGEDFSQKKPKELAGLVQAAVIKDEFNVVLANEVVMRLAKKREIKPDVLGQLLYGIADKDQRWWELRNELLGILEGRCDMVDRLIRGWLGSDKVNKRSYKAIEKGVNSGHEFESTVGLEKNGLRLEASSVGGCKTVARNRAKFELLKMIIETEDERLLRMHLDEAEAS